MNQATIAARLSLGLGVCVLLSACSSAPFHKAPSSESSSIHTAAIGKAPPAEPPSFGSKPLSELNTPDAVAAREAQARLAAAAPPPSFPASQPAAPPPPLPPPAAAPQAAAPAYSPPPPPAPAYAPPLGSASGAPAAAHAQVGAFSKGAKVSARPGSALRLRPSSSSEAIQSLLLDTPMVLDSRVYNAEGYWWYVTAGADDGWVAQSDLLIP